MQVIEKTVVSFDFDEVLMDTNTFFGQYVDLALRNPLGTSAARGFHLNTPEAVNIEGVMDNADGVTDLNEFRLRTGIHKGYELLDDTVEGAICDFINNVLVTHGFEEEHPTLPDFAPIEEAAIGVKTLLEILDLPDELHLITARHPDHEVMVATRSLLDRHFGHLACLNFNEFHFLGNGFGHRSAVSTKAERLSDLEQQVIDSIDAEALAVRSLLVDDTAKNLFRIDVDPRVSYIGVLFGDYPWTDHSILETEHVIHLPSWSPEHLERFGNELYDRAM